MADHVLRARAHLLDVPSGRVKLATLHYVAPSTEIGWLTFSTLPTLQHYFLQAIHAQVGFAMRGIMSPLQRILRWSSRYWIGVDEFSESGSYMVYNVPSDLQAGVYNRAGLENIGRFPNVNFTLSRGPSSEAVGVAPKRAAHFKVMCASEAFEEAPPILFATEESQAIADAIAANITLESVPIVDFTALSLYPIVAKFTYADEALSSDPDSTANDRLEGFLQVGNVYYSNVGRYDTKDAKSIISV